MVGAPAAPSLQVAQDTGLSPSVGLCSPNAQGPGRGGMLVDDELEVVDDDDVELEETDSEEEDDEVVELLVVELEVVDEDDDVELLSPPALNVAIHAPANLAVVQEQVVSCAAAAD